LEDTKISFQEEEVKNMCIQTQA